MFCLNRDFPLGKSVVWHGKANIIDTKFLFKYLQSLDYEKGNYKGRDIRREQRWYHREGKYFNHKWQRYKRWESFNYTPILRFIQSRINYFVKHIIRPKEPWKSNSILINRYINGGNVIPKHRDSEDVFGDNPIIVVYSIGASRTIRFTRVGLHSNAHIKGEKIVDVRLNDGDLLIMSGTVQKYYVHEILKETEDTGERFSLTFRVHKM
jgi:alkylated DNA repair dioxygenase AlkB